MNTHIEIVKSKALKTKPDFNNLGFGQYFTDHIFQIKYSEDKGWHSPQIMPYQDFNLDPGASVFHYGQALFEGMKAFKQKNNKIVLFRPEYNFKRLRSGAERLCMQAPPDEIMLEGIKKLVELDQDWIPTNKGSALYIRPTLIGTEAFLGVRPSKEYLFYVILSPVGSYYQNGLSPVSIWVETQYVRASNGGLGATKAGANYANSLLAAQNARKLGHAQVLWLDTTHTYVEEVGTMNVFFKVGDEILTPALDGTILAGGVRDSVIQLLKAQGHKILERKITIKELQTAYKAGLLTEAFGTGTAAIITAIGSLTFENENWILNNNKIGQVAEKLYNQITALQMGEAEDTYKWVVPVK